VLYNGWTLGTEETENKRGQELKEAEEHKHRDGNALAINLSFLCLLERVTGREMDSEFKIHQGCAAFLWKQRVTNESLNILGCIGCHSRS
jgi:hypothetical protein